MNGPSLIKYTDSICESLYKRLLCFRSPLNLCTNIKMGSLTTKKKF